MGKNKIPQAVLELAKDRLDIEGGFVKYIGSKDGAKVYYSAIEDAECGFPTVYMYKNGEVIEVWGGCDALKIASHFFKD